MGCGRGVPVASDLSRRDPTPREAYDLALEDAGLGGTELVAQWRAAARTAVRDPTAIEPPFREATYYPADTPTAIAYQVSLERGQALKVTLHVEPADSAGVFLDIFRQGADGSLKLVASPSRGATQVGFEPRREGTFVVRVQPELLRSTRVTLSVVRGATLAFPVLGGGRRDIGSRFGASREGGRRSHHGVDIFAPRGTPVLAAAPGRVSRVEETRLGGRVVWVRDDARRQSIYYAHLDRQLVEEGERVRVGDTLGLVGNTGNARTTPPHLHFGIYVRGEGPLDPFTFIDRPPTRLPTLRSDSVWLGDWVRLESDARITGSGAGARTELAPSADSTGLAPLEPADPSLPRNTIVRVIGVFGSNLRVLLPDGRMVVVRDAALESIERQIEVLVVRPGQRVLSRPRAGAIVAGQVEVGGALPVLGRYGSFRLVRVSPELEGWVTGTP